MTEVQEVLQKQEPYFKMGFEKKGGKYAHTVVSVSFLCAPGMLEVFRARALEELKDAFTVISKMEDPEA